MDEKKMYAVDYCFINKQGNTVSVRTMVHSVCDLLSEVEYVFEDAKFVLALHFTQIPPEEVRKVGVVKV